MENIQIDVCIVSFNKASETLRAIQSLDHALLYTRVLICDQSNDESQTNQLIQLLNKHYPDTVFLNTLQEPNDIDFSRHSHIFIRKNRNNGFAAGINTLLKFSLDNPHPKNQGVFILNDDAMMDNDTMHLLKDKILQLNKPAIIGMPIYDLEEPNRLITYGGKIHPYFATAHEIQSITDFDRIDYCNGAALYISSEIIKNIGYWDEKYFMYYEESDFCLRARKANYELFVLDTARVLHAHGGKRPSPYTDRMQLRNRLWFALKWNYPMPSVRLGLCISVLIRLKRGQWSQALWILRLSLSAKGDIPI